MDEIQNKPLHLSKGVKVEDLCSGEAYFHIDLDFKKKSVGAMYNCDEDMFPDMGGDDSDDEAYKSLEAATERHMLSCPEYQSFNDLASKMIDCLPSGAVKMMILEEGTGSLIPPDAVVKLHYAAYFEQAKTPFDSTLTMNYGDPVHLALGNGRHLPGLEIGLTCIKGPEARFLLLLQPEMAWGEKGILPRIRPEPALFVICLYSVEDTKAGARFNSLPMEEQRKFEVSIETVKSIHMSAKKLYNKKKYIQAIKDYQQSIAILNFTQTDDEDELSELKIYKINSFMNIAICYFKLDKPKQLINILESLDSFIDINKHCKALFYYGKAYEKLNNIDKAVLYYKKALKLEPKNKEIGHKLASIDKYNKESAENERQFWQNAFQSVPEKKIVYDVDDDFKKSVNDMCQELAGINEYAKFDLPSGLTQDEIKCIEDFTSKFEGLVLLEQGEGKKKNRSVVRRKILEDK